MTICKVLRRKSYGFSIAEKKMSDSPLSFNSVFPREANVWDSILRAGKKNAF